MMWLRKTKLLVAKELVLQLAIDPRTRLVLRYLATHEAVHLAVPDHSAKFWLTVQSLCRDAEKAKQWLSANGQKLTVDLKEACIPTAL